VSEILSRLGRGFAKAEIKEKAGPYIQVLKEEDGIGEKEMRYLVDHNLSLYKDFLPAAWKKAIVEQFKPYASSLNDVNDGMLALFVEAITDEVPWFARVVTVDKKGWLLTELAYIKKDLEEALKHDSEEKKRTS
jgi:hypothetical protein